jgi:hypothetical protein
LKSKTGGTLSRVLRRIKYRNTVDAKDDSEVKYGRAVVDFSKRTLKPMASTGAMMDPNRNSPIPSPVLSNQSKHLRGNSADSPELAIGVALTGGLDYDAYRDHLIQQAKRERSEREETEKRQPSPTHFRLEEERRYNVPRLPFKDMTDANNEKIPIYVGDEKIHLSATISPKVFDEESKYFSPYQPAAAGGLVVAELAG